MKLVCLDSQKSLWVDPARVVMVFTKPRKENEFLKDVFLVIHGSPAVVGTDLDIDNVNKILTEAAV